MCVVCQPDNSRLFDLYDKDKVRLIEAFRVLDIDLSKDFAGWEARGDFFYVPIHPRLSVLIDVLCRACLGRYIDQHILAEIGDLYQSLPDHLVGMARWPVYPEIAVRHGFAGSLVWRRLRGHPEMDLASFVHDAYRALSELDGSWRSIPFVQRAAATLRPLAS
jgi:hypothetical protein